MHPKRIHSDTSSTSRPNAIFPPSVLQVLTVTGTKYLLTKAIVSSIPEKPVLADTCAPAAGRRLQSADAEPSYDEYERREYDYNEHKFYKAKNAILYHGTMTVNSRVHNIKFEDGSFQFVSYFETDPTPILATHAEVKDAYVLDPYKIELSYFKKGY
jgi:hypothetical protein